MRKEDRPKNLRVVNYHKLLSGLESILDKYDIHSETSVVSDIMEFINNLDYADIDSIFNDFEKEHDEWNNRRDQFESLVRRQWTDGYCFGIERCIHRLEDSFCLDEFDKYMREEEERDEDKIDT